MISLRTFFNLLIALALVSASEAARICPLCGSVFSVPTRWDFPVSQEPSKTCRDIFFDMAEMTITDDRCKPSQDKYQDVCCNDELPPGWAPQSTPPPSVVQPGTEPVCRICKTNEYPGKPNVVISARYVGTYSCGALYERGRSGLISGFMCGPLQDYAYERCGCGEHNPGNFPPPTPDPSPDPTPDPSPDPTPDPSPDPTPDPSPDPTPAPVTPSPSDEPSNVPSLVASEAPSPAPSEVPSNAPSIREDTEAPSRGAGSTSTLTPTTTTPTTAAPSRRASSTSTFAPATNVFCLPEVIQWCCENGYRACCRDCN